MNELSAIRDPELVEDLSQVLLDRCSGTLHMFGDQAIVPTLKGSEGDLDLARSELLVKPGGYGERVRHFAEHQRPHGHVDGLRQWDQLHLQMGGIPLASPIP